MTACGTSSPRLPKLSSWRPDGCACAWRADSCACRGVLVLEGAVIAVSRNLGLNPRAMKPGIRISIRPAAGAGAAGSDAGAVAAMEVKVPEELGGGSG